MVGPWQTMAVSLGISGALSLLCPLAAHLHPMALASVRLLMGLVQGPSFPALYSVLARWAPPNELATMVTIAFSGKWHGSITSFTVQCILYVISYRGICIHLKHPTSNTNCLHTHITPLMHILLWHHKAFNSIPCRLSLDNIYNLYLMWNLLLVGSNGNLGMFQQPPWNPWTPVAKHNYREPFWTLPMCRSLQIETLITSIIIGNLV